MLATAKAALYPEERADGISLGYQKKHLLRSTDRNPASIRVCPELHSRLAFRGINFMNTDLGIAEKVEGIFCRNVVIYFDRTTQQHLRRKFHRQLRTGGSLFLVDSMMLNDIGVDFTAVGSAVYPKKLNSVFA